MLRRSLLCLFALCLTLPSHAEGFLSRLLHKPVPGGVAVLQLGEQPQAPRVRYQDKPVLVLREDGQRWIAVLGIPLSVKPGTQHAQVDGRQVPFQVGAKRYQEQRITLKNPQQVNPNPDNLRRIERELAEQTRAYRQFSPGLPSNLLFDKPVDGPLSSRFGVRRFFNGEERNPHSGLDFAVPAGTPVKTPAAGKVILLGDYFFNGRTVFVDHGQGLVSMFCHLSRIDVKVGQALPRGAVLGRVGATGRATGAHLHWNVSLNDARVDPAIFIGAFEPERRSARVYPLQPVDRRDRAVLGETADIHRYDPVQAGQFAKGGAVGQGVAETEVAAGPAELDQVAPAGAAAEADVLLVEVLPAGNVLALDRLDRPALPVAEPLQMLLQGFLALAAEAGAAHQQQAAEHDADDLVHGRIPPAAARFRPSISHGTGRRASRQGVMAE